MVIKAMIKARGIQTKIHGTRPAFDDLRRNVVDGAQRSSHGRALQLGCSWRFCAAVL